MTKQFSIMVTALLLFSACKKEEKTVIIETEENIVVIESEKKAAVLTDNTFTAVPMPDELITGNQFPTDSTLINSWVANSTETNNLETNTDIINHGWAIWSALTEITDQTSNNQKLRRFETWYTPQDIIEAYKLQKENTTAKLLHVTRHTGTLKKLNQLHGSTEVIPQDPEEASVIGFVKYDPTAADHIYDNKLFYASTLKALAVKNEIANISDFPNSGVVLKPVFTTLKDKDPETGLYKIPSWPGDGGDTNRAYGSNKWNNYVYITIDGETNASEHIYSIKEFINFKLDSVQAASVGGKTGDYAVLEGMHVTTREIKRWVWQTFWWSEKNNTPYSPSSNTIADLRPKNNLDNAANHYAMAVAYNTVTPAQPYNGGSGKNAISLYAYNPYLEAGFAKNTFTQANDTIRKYYSEEFQKVGGKMNEYGMQTNCMSCHGQARYIPSYTTRSKGHFYITDQYFEMESPYFKSTVKLDFTWSIQGNLINDNEEPVN